MLTVTRKLDLSCTVDVGTDIDTTGNGSSWGLGPPAPLSAGDPLPSFMTDALLSDGIASTTITDAITANTGPTQTYRRMDTGSVAAATATRNAEDPLTIPVRPVRTLLMCAPRCHYTRYSRLYKSQQEVEWVSLWRSSPDRMGLASCGIWPGNVT